MALKCARPMLRPTNAVAARVPPKAADSIYATPEYRQWAQAVKARAGFMCEDCGRSGVRLFADHVIELKDGGAPFDPANGRCRCGSCHSLKTAAEKRRRMVRPTKGEGG